MNFTGLKTTPQHAMYDLMPIYLLRLISIPTVHFLNPQLLQYTLLCLKQKENLLESLENCIGNRNINPSTYKCSILFSLLFLFYPNHFFLQRSFSNLPFSSVLLDTFDFHRIIPRQNQ